MPSAASASSTSAFSTSAASQVCKYAFASAGFFGLRAASSFSFSAASSTARSAAFSFKVGERDGAVQLSVMVGTATGTGTGRGTGITATGDGLIRSSFASCSFHHSPARLSLPRPLPEMTDFASGEPRPSAPSFAGPRSAVALPFASQFHATIATRSLSVLFVFHTTSTRLRALPTSSLPHLRMSHMRTVPSLLHDARLPNGATRWR